jgi:hypothetical protein
MNSTLPVLAARIRPNKRPRSGEGEWLVGCGVRDCPGVLATLRVSPWEETPFVRVTRLIPAGFVERAEGHFALGNHAARSARHVPRRPKQSSLHGRYAQWCHPIEMDPYAVDENGRYLSRPHTNMGWDLPVTCPERGCGRESVLTHQQFREFEEQYARAHGRGLYSPPDSRRAHVRYPN